MEKKFNHLIINNKPKSDNLWNFFSSNSKTAKILLNIKGPPSLITNKVNFNYGMNFFYSFYLINLFDKDNTNTIKSPAHWDVIYGMWYFQENYSYKCGMIWEKTRKPRSKWADLGLTRQVSSGHHYAFILEDHLKNKKIKNYSLQMEYISNLKLSILYSKEQHFNYNELKIPFKFWYPKGLCPIVMSIDSEFVDMCKPNTNAFDNERISYPLSVGLKMHFLNDPSTYVYKTYVFDKSHFDHLNQNVIDKNLIKSLEHISYTPSKNYLNIDQNIDIHYIKDESCFEMALHVFNNINWGQEYFYMYYLSPNYIQKHKITGKILNIPLLFYFSIKDLKYFFGSEIYHLIEPFLLSGRKTWFTNYTSISPFAFYLKNKKTNEQYYYRIELIDLFGIDSSGLINLAHIVNINMGSKKLLDNYKENMALAISQCPEIYMWYLYDDVSVLFPIYVKTFGMIYDLYKKFNLPYIPCILAPKQFNIKTTVGSLTASYFEQYILNLDPMLEQALDNISVKLLRKDFNSRNVHLIHGLEMGSAKYLNRIGGSAIEACIVQGGRVCNEVPNERFFEYGLDMDYTSCYGTGMLNIPYCVGRPSVLRNDEGGFKCSLRDFLKDYEKHLVPGCWYIVVGTKPNEPLPFNLDLLVSKIVSTDALKKKIEQPESMSQNTHLSGDQVVLLNEIKHAVIVDETLNIIKKFATSKELNDLKSKLYVISAVFYPKKLECPNANEFVLNVSNYATNQEISKKLKNEIKIKKTECLDDSRDCKIPGYWFKVDMNNFIGKLVEERQELKQLFKKTGDQASNAKQNFYKLIINTVYGITASRFFKVSNLTFSNNITGKARTSVWVLSKAFNLKQTITDGGIYTINKVMMPWENNLKKPGFNKLTNLQMSKDPKDSKYFQPLGQKNDWIETYKDLKSNHENKDKIKNFISKVDLLANNHLKKFCDYYGVVPKYSIEHKPENIFLRASTLGRAHYFLYTIYGTELFKIRGTQQNNGVGYILSPIYEFLKNKAFADRNKIISLSNIIYTQRSLLKTHNIKQFKKNIKTMYIEHDLSLHSTVITKRCFFMIYDCGKYSTHLHLKNMKSKKTLLKGYCFLDSNCFINNCKNGLSINSDKFWTSFESNYQDLISSDKVVRFTTNDNNVMTNLLKNAEIFDQNVTEFINPSKNDIPDFEDDSKKDDEFGLEDKIDLTN